MSLRHLFGAMRSQHDREVTAAKVSPLNPLRWNLSLSCGHDKWITAKRKPTRKTDYCEKCAVSSSGEGKR